MRKESIYIYKYLWVFVMLIILGCTVGPDQPFFKSQFEFDENRMELKIVLCNKTQRSLFIQAFASPAVHLKVFRLDTLTGSYQDYTHKFMNKWQGELFTLPYKTDVSIKHKLSRKGADSLTKAICEAYLKRKDHNAKNVSGYGESIISESIYSTILFNPRECTEETISLKTLSEDGGKFKLFLRLPRKDTVKNDDNSNYSKFLYNIVP